MRRPYTILRVTTEFKNPKRDRRCSHGFASLDVIPAGTFVRYRDNSAQRCAPTVAIMRPGKRASIGVDYAAVDLFKPGAANIEASEPRTAAEMLCALDVEHCADHVLQMLMDAGKINAADIGQAVAALEAKWDAEEAA